jgi:hypothetical protein
VLSLPLRLPLNLASLSLFLQALLWPFCCYPEKEAD